MPVPDAETQAWKKTEPLPVAREMGGAGYARCPACQSGDTAYIAGHVSACRGCGILFAVPAHEATVKGCRLGCPGIVGAHEGAAWEESPGAFGARLARENHASGGAPRGDLQGVIEARYHGFQAQEEALAAFDAEEARLRDGVREASRGGF